mmetsp:Transcript_23200/g.39778  ORF Transcript_23200/g.39778 Transcript_23200/m.39778 type:complete len:241 (-) Transcript_23200:897-1619(-)
MARHRTPKTGFARETSDLLQQVLDSIHDLRDQFFVHVFAPQPNGKPIIGLHPLHRDAVGQLDRRGSLHHLARSTTPAGIRSHTFYGLDQRLQHRPLIRRIAHRMALQSLAHRLALTRTQTRRNPQALALAQHRAKAQHIAQFFMEQGKGPDLGSLRFRGRRKQRRHRVIKRHKHPLMNGHGSRPAPFILAQACANLVFLHHRDHRVGKRIGTAHKGRDRLVARASRQSVQLPNRGQPPKA